MLKLSHLFVWLLHHRWLTLVALAAAFGGCVYSTLPPRVITIETGSLGGSYYQVAQQYKTALEKQGFVVEIHPRDQSMMLISDVNDPASNADVGFVAQSTDAALYPNVTTLGSIDYQPLFVFYRANLTAVTRLNDLRGLRVALAPRDSATTVAALALLKEYGVDPGNTAISYAPVGEVARRIKAGEADAAFLMLEAGNPIIEDLGADENVRMLSLPQASAIAQRFSFLHAAVIPAGTYSLAANMPAEPVNVVAATAEVVVRKNMHPAVVYALLTAMSAVHSQAGIMVRQDEFPALTDPQLPANTYAQDYYKNGLPWTHRNLNTFFATMFDSLLVLLLPILLVMPVYQWLGLPTASEAYARLRLRIWLNALRKINARIESGASLTLHQRTLLRVIQEGLDADGDLMRECSDLLHRAKLQNRRAELHEDPPRAAA